jgi:hypothetical protein
MCHARKSEREAACRVHVFLLSLSVFVCLQMCC